MQRHVDTTKGYSDDAAALAQQYERIRFDELHRDVLPYFPSPPSDVLDIGAGSGRDAAALVRLGHRVVAVEPTAALRREGQRIHASLPIEWIDDALPSLMRVLTQHRVFDLVLLCAVWMHLDRDARAAAMRSVAALLAKGGIVAMSLRHGPVPAGRTMFDVSAEETIALGREAGLVEQYRGTREDAQRRSDVTWSVVVMRR